MRRRNLGLVHRHNGGQHADAETSHDSAQHHHAHVDSKGLQGAAHKEDAGSIEYCFSSANDIANAADHQGRDEGTNLEDGYHGPDLGLGRLIEVFHKVITSGSGCQPSSRYCAVTRGGVTYMMMPDMTP